MNKTDAAGILERFGTKFDNSRSLFSKIWKMGILMAKGAYLIGERRRLFVKLGESVYEKILRGEMTNKELEPLVHQLDRLTKKVEIEEMLILNLRFGSKASRGGRGEDSTPPDSNSESASR